MDKRFALSVAGIAGAATAGSAFAGGDAVIVLEWDKYAGEASFQMLSTGYNSVSGGLGVVAYVQGTSVLRASSGSILADFAFAVGSSAYTSGYTLTFTLANATGNYNVSLLDSYGDGWASGVDGLDAFNISGSVAGDTNIAFTTGTSATGQVTITPAPGALALLGLAGLAGRRKRA